MRKSKVLQKIRAGKCARFCAMGHYLPFYIRYAAHHDFDGIWLDLEHRAMDQREIQSVLSMCHQHDIDAMVRAPTQERTKLYRYFEDGASGSRHPPQTSATHASDTGRSSSRASRDHAAWGASFSMSSVGDSTREVVMFNSGGSQ